MTHLCPKELKVAGTVAPERAEGQSCTISVPGSPEQKQKHHGCHGLQGF